MKKNSFYYMGLVAGILGSAMITSCSADDPEGPVNSAATGETVKTTFAISVPTGTTGGASTRQEAEITQRSGTFRGLENIYLFTYKTDKTKMTSGIKLDNFSSFTNEYGTGSGTNADGGYKLYSNVEIPIGTKNFLFYANAPKTAGVDDVDTKFINGSLTPTNLETTTTDNTDISFAPELILPDASNLETDEGRIVAYLNRIAAVAGWKTTTNETLARYYRALTALKAGSATSIKYFLQDLYTKLDGIDDVAADEGSVGKIAYNIMYAIVNDAIIANSVTDGTITWADAFPNIPDDYNLPQGCLRLQHVEGTGFSYEAFVSTNPTLTFDQICYPAELYYYVDSEARVSTNDEVVWPADLAKWYDTAAEYWIATATYKWTNEVIATTHTVALKNPVNYGVAQLEVKVKCVEKTEDAGLEDNANGYINGAATQSISIPAGGFPITGILIGGQPETVDYEFMPAATDDFNKVIYDRTIATKIIGDDENTYPMVAKKDVYSIPNYTLVLDNNKAGGQQNVMVAIELVNNTGEDFYGVDGLVVKGAKFYLVGELNLKAASTTGFVDGVVDHVFQKDYVTTANFTISSLKNAYGTIPDLTKSQLQLGLAVDLYWQTGLSFEVEL